MNVVNFVQTEHLGRRREVIEVFVNGFFRAAIYPDDEGGIKIISAHLREQPKHIFENDPDIWQFLFKDE